MINVAVADGKYRVTFVRGKLTAYRYDEIWRDLTGDNLVLALAQRIEELEKQLNEVSRQLDTAGHD